MATQEIDVAIHIDQSAITVAAADNTIASSMSLHWDDTLERGALQDLAVKIFNAFTEHQSDNYVPPA